MKKIIALVMVLMLVGAVACNKDDDKEQVNVTVAGLASLTGSWSTLGITSQEALRIAAEDINQYMEQERYRYRFSVKMYDTKLEVSTAQAAMEDAWRNKIRWVVGPQSSAEVEGIMPYANEHGMLVVSQSSTASSLAVAGDGVFRFCPTDAVEGKAMAASMYTLGRRAAISVALNSAGNVQMQQSFDAAFRLLGGTVDHVAPYAVNTSDFSSLLAEVKNRIQEAVALLGADKVGVYLASYDETKELFQQAAGDAVLSSVRWYGADGVTLSSVLIADAVAAGFAADVGFIAPALALPSPAQGELARVIGAIKEQTGLEPDAFALAAYDALWVIAKTVVALQGKTEDFAAMKSSFLTEANAYEGLTGPMVLNGAGDRATGSYDYWGIVREGGGFVWKVVGRSL